MALLLSDLKLGLSDLLAKKKSLLEATNTGKTYLPLLAEQLHAIDALPAGGDSGTPLAAQLAERDAEHDGFGGAVWFLTEAYVRCPSASDEVQAAAARIRAQFIPALAELKATFADEANKARDRDATLKDFKDDLKLFPVAEGETLFDWVRGYLDAGLGLQELLSDRASTPLDSRAGAPALRATVLGLLSRMRGALDDELAANKKLPRDLAARAFAYFDQLANNRPAPKKRGKSAKTAPVASGGAPGMAPESPGE